MVAGPGYGKTQAMVSYLIESATEAIGLSLTRLDNLPTHFWNHLIKALKPRYPELSQSLYSLGFPDTLSKFDDFTQLLDKNCSEPSRLILVCDNFGVINDNQILSFFKMLVEMELDKFPLVLISSEPAITNSIGLLSRKRAVVLAKDLRFTPSEIAGLYYLHKMPLKPDEINHIEQFTEGWPLALNLLVQRRNRATGALLVDESAISQIFEEIFFSAYTKQQQLMLVKLSLLNNFTMKLAMDLYDGNLADFQNMENHAFLNSDSATGQYFMHRLYKLFLQKKRYLLTSEDERQTWKKAAEYHTASGGVLEAISCYRQSEDHAGMLKVICDHATKHDDLIETNADFFLEHIDLMPPEVLREYPVADFLRADIYIKTLKLEKAETLLADLERRLLGRNLADETTLLGEVYVAQGFVNMIRNRENYGDYFKKATDFLPEGSKYRSKNDRLTQANNISFTMPDNLPGAKERTEITVRKAIPWISKALHGFLDGMEHIISAESAYLSYDLVRAKQQAYQCIFKARSNAQHDFSCIGHFILARVSWLEGDLAEMTQQIQNIVEYAAKHKVFILEETLDTALTWFYIQLRDYDQIPNNSITINYSKRPILTNGYSQILHAKYLIIKEDYAKLVGMLEHSRGLFLSSGIWSDRIYLSIMLAVGYHHLGNPEAAMDALWMAYDMCRYNGLIACFIEGGEYVCALIQSARQQSKYKFDHEWLNLVYNEANDFARQAEAVRAEYRDKNSVKTAEHNPLSKREREVLQALSQGLTREEIALEQYISVNTVKSVIRSIYNKLDSNNRAEAVSIAISHGYIEGYSKKNDRAFS